MKKLLIIMAVILSLGLTSCDKEPVPVTDNPPVIDEVSDNTSESDIPDVTEPTNENDEVKTDPPTPVEQYASSANNNINGGMILYADDYFIYDDFVIIPDDEYTGGEHRLYRQRTDGESAAEQIFVPYFPARNMCIYDNALYFTYGGGGGRSLTRLDLDTLERKNLHSNLDPEYGLFIDSLQLHDGMLYFECNGSIFRMKPDESEFEVLLDGKNDFSCRMIGVVDKYVFYASHNNYELRRINIETKEQTWFMDNFVDNIVNFYDNRIYYTDGKKLISSDLDGFEKRTVLEIAENEVFSAVNIADGYVYYVVNNIPKNPGYDGIYLSQYQKNKSGEFETLYEYNLNGGERRELMSGSRFTSLTYENGKLYFYIYHYDIDSTSFIELDPRTLNSRAMERE